MPSVMLGARRKEVESQPAQCVISHMLFSRLQKVRVGEGLAPVQHVLATITCRVDQRMVDSLARVEMPARYPGPEDVQPALISRMAADLGGGSGHQPAAGNIDNLAGHESGTGGGEK